VTERAKIGRPGFQTVTTNAYSETKNEHTRFVVLAIDSRTAFTASTL